MARTAPSEPASGKGQRGRRIYQAKERDFHHGPERAAPPRGRIGSRIRARSYDNCLAREASIGPPLGVAPWLPRPEGHGVGPVLSAFPSSDPLIASVPILKFV